jgi:hypothetical protein
MDQAEQGRLWVVYRMTLHGKQDGVLAVCDQGEWEAMEFARPGYHTLIRAGIANEGEAEKVARVAQGGSGNGTVRLKAR